VVEVVIEFPKKYVFVRFLSNILRRGCNPQERNGTTGEEQKLNNNLLSFCRGLHNNDYLCSKLFEWSKADMINNGYSNGRHDVPSLDSKLHLPMTNENASTPKNETFTWLEPGAWRKPCIVHVTMVANSRQSLFGKLSHNGSEALNEIGRLMVDRSVRSDFNPTTYIQGA